MSWFANGGMITAGTRVYHERNCAYCHSINGVGGAAGPDLSNIGATTDQQALTAYLQDPSSVVMHTLHPKLAFTNDELSALAAYLLTLGAPVPHSPEAPMLVEQHCLACHTINGKGGKIGPDLSNEGNLRTLAFLASFTSDPRSINPSATMPAFKSALTPEQINDIAAYLYSLRQSTRPTTPTSTPAPK